MAWGFFKSIKKGLAKTREQFGRALSTIIVTDREVDQDFLGELEAALIGADLGPRLAAELVDSIHDRFKAGKIETTMDIPAALKADLEKGLREKDLTLAEAEAGPTVILLVGVNGTGKTTTTAKLASRFSKQGKKVLLAAADTFRAAAGEQLEVWAERLGVDIVRHASGADPAAVVFDACEAAKARAIDYVIIDTAGRLHTKENLMRELAKIRRVASKQIDGAPHEILLVLDATTGQNAMSQAKTFAGDVGITGLVLCKLDGTARGGIAIAINRTVELPIKLIGVGESEDDLADFDPTAFVEAMFSGFNVESEPEMEESE